MQNRNRLSPGKECLTYLGQRWTTRILGRLGLGSRRYAELERECAVGPKMLARVLRNLERDGLIARFESPALRRQVAYQLTPLGHSFCRLAGACDEWATEHEGAIVSARQAFDPAGSRVRASGGPPIDSNITRASERRGGDDSQPLMMSFLSVVVTDIEAAARAYADVFSTAVPRIIDGEVSIEDRRTIPVRLCWVGFRNFFIGLIERTAWKSPYSTFVERRGPAIHHFGFDVADQLGDYIRLFEEKGGRCTIGGARHRYADLDFRERLGTVVELIDRRLSARSASGVGGLGGSHVVTNLGVLVGDIEQAATDYRAILGLHMSPVRTVHFNCTSSPRRWRASAQVGTVRQNGMAIKLIQPTGPSPLSRVVERFGSVAHHVGFCVKDALAETVVRLERAGGRRLVGAPDDDYVQIDMSEQLGLVLELTRTPTAAS